MFAAQLAQRGARISSPFLAFTNLLGLVRATETYSAFLLGKGSGAGWDSAGEASALKSVSPDAPLTIFDVGANDGAWAVQLAKLLGRSDNRFFLFECAPYCYPGLEMRWAQIPNPVLIKCAVSDTTGAATLHMPTQGSGLASLHARNDKCVNQEQYEEFEVETTTLDLMAKTYGIEHIHILKMDIEGHELTALHGAKRLLSEGRIDAIQFEFGSANVNSRTFFRDFWSLLSEHYGYSIQRMLPGGRLLKVSGYYEDLEYFRGATNYLALRGR
jgi:FkbM family methyltransferase